MKCLMKSFFVSFIIGTLFSITIYAQETHLRKMQQGERNEYLVKLSKEVIKNFGPDYYHVCDSSEITGPFVFDESHGLFRPSNKNYRGRKYYKVTFVVDSTKHFFSWGYAAYVLVWEKSGEPMQVMFGNGMGKHFLGRSYRKWLEMGLQEEDIMPYEESELLKQIYEEKRKKDTP